MSRAVDLRVLGAAVRQLRIQAGLSQEGLADEAGLHRTYIGGVERGERNASFLSLSRMITALGVGWREFGAIIDRGRR